MNPTRQDRSKDPGKRQPPTRAPNPSAPSSQPQNQPEDQWESAEEIRQNSRTAQDRDHTIRRGDSVTTQTKEFPG